MAHIVVITGGLRGLLNASLALIAQLQQRGHQITYASPRDISQSLQPLDIPFVQLAPWAAPVETGGSSRWHKLFHLRQRQQQAVAALQMDKFAEALRSLSPDLLLIDIEMHPHIIAAVAADYSVGLLCPFISIWRDLKMPPIHTPIIPGQGWRGQWWGIQWSWLRYSWQKWRAYQRDRWAKVGCDYLSVLRCYARQIGHTFPNGFSVNACGFSTWLFPYPYRQLPVLCLHAKALDFPSAERPWVHYVGPMVPVKESDTSKDIVQLELDAFLKNRTKEKTSNSPNRPLIYCGFSSFALVSQPLLQHLITVAIQQPNWDFVIGLGGHNPPKLVQPIPANVCLLPWAPQRAVLSQSSCAVINGGAHTITECIHFGVPMLVSPIRVNDQLGNAARVAYHGLGLLHQDKLHQHKHSILESVPNQIQQQLQVLLSNKCYHDRLKMMREAFQRYTADTVATQAVESLLPIRASRPSQEDAL